MVTQQTQSTQREVRKQKRELEQKNQVYRKAKEPKTVLFDWIDFTGLSVLFLLQSDFSTGGSPQSRGNQTGRSRSLCRESNGDSDPGYL